MMAGALDTELAQMLLHVLDTELASVRGTEEYYLQALDALDSVAEHMDALRVAHNDEVEDGSE